MQLWGWRLPRTLRGGEEHRQVVELLGVEASVPRHDAVAESSRIDDVVLEECERLPRSADRREVVPLEASRACAGARALRRGRRAVVATGGDDGGGEEEDGSRRYGIVSRMMSATDSISTEAPVTSRSISSAVIRCPSPHSSRRS